MRALGVPPQLTPVRVVAQVLMTALVWWATRLDTDRPIHPDSPRSWT